MDNAISPTAANLPLTVTPGGESFGTRLAAMPTRSKVMMAGGLAVLAGAVLAMTLWTNQGDFRPVFTGLSDKDGGAVIAQLTTLGVPYRNEPGGTILVPAGQVYDVRMKLASAGLPKGSTVGFELMDKSSIGQTQFNERLNFQRGLEGELVRTITALADVADARVHLAMPQQNGFFREQQKPSASVMLTLRGGHTLDRGQIAGIVHLVSASVPELSPKAVSVLDQTGALLSNPGNDGSGNGLDTQQLQYKQQIEANTTKRIYELLEPVVGRENLRATVTADVDFSQVESTAEEFKPNQGQNASAAVRSSQTNESTNGTPALPTGVPGAATNQPPVPATAPINGASAPLQVTGGNASNSSRREAVTNFELDKTVRVVRNATGQVRRLNVAVVLNHRSSTDPKGKVNSVPVPQEELDKLTALVKETMGFSQERGDSLKVITAPFMNEKPESIELPLWKQPMVLDIVRAAAVPLALVLVALIAVFGMVRPAIRAVNPPPPEVKDEDKAEGAQELSAIVDEENHLPAVLGANGLPALEAPVSNDKLERARLLARENPVAVANIMRSWMTGEAA
ncbi:flagellar basal-body MS-ring/collar protein FliF [Roseateles koreensis]|uniref:Flagellar M-ring protein n=1 Tax=Roseateles koreensis TaxID=2987526 RepID=A0ABT5KX67_9BURK|nr:flagellar basal-body MS-ring/collar protein FliF [Roseateles koreensis]MDC8786367.1 flagellar basal-body MS-ring/collar protein FliF [Roseateles koreensis]